MGNTSEPYSTGVMSEYNIGRVCVQQLTIDSRFFQFVPKLNLSSVENNSMTERPARSKQHWYIANRRRHSRLDRNVPITIFGPADQHEPITETTETLDISETGVRLLLASNVTVGEQILISANEPELKAHLAAFEVRWSHPVEDRFLIGAELDIPSYKWSLDVD
jgi:hypothetical protein